MLDPSRICLGCMSPLPFAGAACPLCGTTDPESINQSHQLPAGSILAGTYLVGRALGQGGFGITYVGWDLVFDQKVAIKEYYPDGFVTREMTTHSTVTPMRGEKGEFFAGGKQKFVDEARVLARFADDPCIVNVRRFFQENSTAYIVMDFVEGKTLKALAGERGGRLPAGEVLEMLTPLMESLSQVHGAGLLHRDIAPDNIMLGPDGGVKLLDFGAARQISTTGERSLTINVKHGYAPQEQYRTHGEQGPWTDIHALCATIYFLTTGQLPPQAMDRAIDNLPVTPPNELGADFTPSQQAAILRGLSLRGGDRQQSMRQLMDELSAQAPLEPSQGKRRGEGAAKDPPAQRRRPGGKGAASGEREGAKRVPGEPAKQRQTEDKPQSKPRLKPAVAAVAGVVALLAAALILALESGSRVPQTAAITTSAPTAIQVGNYTLTVTGNEAVISGYTGSVARLDIPSLLGGYRVIGIGGEAFSGCTALTTVTIPEGVTSIEDSAFRNCISLTSVAIPKSVTSIGSFVFDNCSNRLTLHAPAGSYGEQWAKENKVPFSASSSSGSMVSSGSTSTQTGDYTFTVTGNEAVINGYTGSEAKLDIPSQLGGYRVTGIGDWAFNNCTSLTSVTIPTGVTSIGDRAFCYCIHLTSVTIPKSVISIGIFSFEHCSNGLTLHAPAGSYGELWAKENSVSFAASSSSEAMVSSGSTSIQVGNYALTVTGNEAVISGYTGSVARLDIPSQLGGYRVTGIGDEAFYNCTSLTSVTIPASVTEIGDRAFYYCTHLHSVTISRGVTSIGDSAFFQCTALSSVTIPEGVTSIGKKAFSGCDFLTSVTIPKSVTSIGENAFYHCYDIIYFRVSAGSYGERWAKENKVSFKAT